MQAMRLWQRKNNVWYIDYERGISKSLETKDAKIAKEIFKRLQKEALMGRLVRLEKGEMKLFKSFTEEYLNIRTIKSKSTQKNDRLALTHFLDYYGNRAMAGITSKKLDEYRVYLINKGISKVGANAYIRHFKTAIKTARKWGYIKERNNGDLLEDFKQFKVDKSKPIYMTTENVKTLLRIATEMVDKNMLPDFMLTAVAIMIWTGCGRAEIMSPIIFREDTLVFKRIKTGETYSVPVADSLKPYISHLEPGIVKIVKWQNPRTFSKYFEKIVNEAGLKGISPHKVRHTFATTLLRQGEDLKTIQKLMGHKSIQITADFYAHLEDEKKKQAVNKLNFD